LLVHLTRAGFQSAWLNRIFDRPCVRLNYSVLTLRLSVRESRLDYGRFLEEAPLNEARQFMARHRTALDRAQAEFEVPGEIVVAILLVETALGKKTGRHPTLAALATHAAADQPDVAEQTFTRLDDDVRKRYTQESAAQRLAGRAAWSFKELKAFLAYIQKTRDDPCQVMGSYTGAIGLCQFQPSNLKPYGRDGNGDGVVDLFQVEDAVFSTASYLKKNGWRPRLTQAKRLRVLKRYNNSEPYARTILDVAERLQP